jgi:dihydrofolate synthase/folylpolyglutamate synthase
MSYSETISYIYNLQKHGIKLGLSNITRLVSILGNPHKSFPSVHVAGTNGKGSTSAFIASILRASGLKVGLFTSPHLVSFTERIKVNDEEITEYEVVSLTEEIRSKVADFSPTFFEVVTAMVFLYFQRKGIDIAVIEVGMGGRLDATNILVPEVSVITSIDYDHMEFLGETIKEVANEKAGIIKDSIPVVISSQTSEVLKVIEAKARERNSEVYLYGRDFSAVLKRDDPSGICFDYFGDSFAMHDLYLPLAGEHQMQNASVAIKAATISWNKIGKKRRNAENEKGRKIETGISPVPRVPDSPVHEEEIMSLIRKGLASVRWPGRLEMIKDDPPILLDGAHNPAAAVILSRALVKNFLGIYKKIILILGIMGDKDIEGIMRPILPIASEIILTSPSYERAAPPAKLASIAASLGFPEVRIAPTLQDAIEMARNICKQSNSPSNSNNPHLPPFSKGGMGGFVKGGSGRVENSSLVIHHSSLIVITGSFYTIGEAKEALGQKGILTRLRE